jgi:diadenosine tetraphosphate (Ap4A) HIT family hydrolase
VLYVANQRAIGRIEDWRRDRIASAERGENPTVLLRLPSGFAAMGDTQFLPGYCLLLAVPRVPDLHALTLPERMVFLRDMSLLGESVQRVCQPLRINYEIFGNTDPFLHAHVLPRYAWEPDEYRKGSASHYPRGLRLASELQFSKAAHGALQARLTAALRGLVEESK